MLLNQIDDAKTDAPAILGSGAGNAIDDGREMGDKERVRGMGDTYQGAERCLVYG